MKHPLLPLESFLAVPRICTGLCVLALASTAVATPPLLPVPAANTAKEHAQGFSDRVVLAKPRAHHRGTVDATEAGERVRVHRTFARFGDVRVIELDGTETVAAGIARLQATGRYEYVEPSRILQPNGIPNDASFPAQWSLNNTGQTVGGVVGTPGADIKAVAAWDVINDASGVIVAVIDTGVRLTHPDLVPNLWRNPAPTFGDINGARFASGTGVATNGDPTDDSGHGTRTAGIIGAAGNNNLLTTGVAWKVQIMALKVNSSTFATADVVACIDYAIAHGAKVINCSFSDDVFSPTTYAALKAARDAGVIVVCSAGNTGGSSDTTPRYPANYPLDNIVAVGWTNNQDAIPTGANYGAAIDLFAPGVSIPSLSHTSDTAISSGNGASPAAPHVTGSLALLKARFPNDTYRQLINRLLRSTDRKPALLGLAQSGGRLNLFNAVTSTSNRPMNDDFATRANVSGEIATIRSSNAGATTEPGESAHAGAPAAATLWWEWTAPYTGPATIDTAGSEYDTVVAVYAGATLGALTAVAANDDAPGRTTSLVTFNAQAGTTYQFAVGSKGTATGLTLAKLTQPPPNESYRARLSNLAILTDIAAAGDSFTMGYVVGGVGTTGTKSVLIRAAGPALASLGVPGGLADPRLELFAGSTQTAENDNWGGTADLRAAISGYTGFPFANPASLDAAVLANIPPGDNSVRISATGPGTGRVIAEIYDVTPSASFLATTPRLVNVSVLKNLGTVLIAGFVVGGTGSKTVLIRVVGPTLGAAPFDVPGAVADPQLTLFSGQTMIGSNDNWGGGAELTAAFAKVGAFALPPESRDAALLATLQPGAYTVQARGVGGTTGVAIVEIYEVP
ncbi:MAG: S8 family serine peptidase [Verrucomicrobia bacterium]|nr:S8 family serine peptidase [Verrucomicrobiota bacterium]